MSDESKRVTLPSGWKWVRLGDGCDFVGGGTPSKTKLNYWNGKINWASVKDVKGDYLNKTEDTITELGLKNSASNIAEPNELILITRISPGKTTIANVRTAINQDLKIVKPKFKTSSKFLRYFFQSRERELIKLSSGTTVLGITLNKLNEIEIPILSLVDQTELVSKLELLFSELDKGKQQLETAQQQLKIYRQAVLKWAFEGRLTPPAGHWKLTKLRDASLKIVVGYVGPITSHIVDGNGVKFLSTTHIGENILLKNPIREVSYEFSERNKKSLVIPGDILIARHGDSGKACIVPSSIEFAQVSNAVILRPDPTMISSKFICYRINAERQRMQKQKVGGVFQVVNTSSMSAFQVSIPPIDEQARVVQEIEVRLTVCDKLEESITASLQQVDSLRQSILKKAFEGRLLTHNAAGNV